MARTPPPPKTPQEPIGDYLVNRDLPRVEVPTSVRVLHVVNALLLVVLAAVSLALALVVATLLGVI